MASPDECGCHPGCTTLPHECEKPCTWPKCMSEAETAEFIAEMERDGFQ